MFSPRPLVIFSQGIAQYVTLFEKDPPPARQLQELPKERKTRMAAERDALNAEKNELLMLDWDPKKNYKATV